MSTRHPRLARLAVAAACTVALTSAGAAVTSSAGAAETAGTAAAARPAMKVPFTCGQEWRGATYAGHSPANAIDFNQGGGDDDFGLPVKASAAGTVTSIRYYPPSPGDSTYGYTVQIAHSGGWSSFYAHLKQGSVTVAVGDSVSATTTIAKVGKSGDQATSHLHYEQRLNGSVEKIVLAGRAVAYPSTAYYTRPC